jgi:hypothetical protein
LALKRSLREINSSISRRSLAGILAMRRAGCKAIASMAAVLRGPAALFADGPCDPSRGLCKEILVMPPHFVPARLSLAFPFLPLIVLGAFSVAADSPAFGQLARRLTPRGPSLRNDLPASLADGVRNVIIEPIPLTAQRLSEAQAGVERQIRDQVEEFRAKIKQVFPDEIDALSGTSKWRPEDRAARC